MNRDNKCFWNFLYSKLDSRPNANYLTVNCETKLIHLGEDLKLDVKCYKVCSDWSFCPLSQADVPSAEFNVPCDAVPSDKEGVKVLKYRYFGNDPGGGWQKRKKEDVE